MYDCTEIRIGHTQAHIAAVKSTRTVLVLITLCNTHFCTSTLFTHCNAKTVFKNTKISTRQICYMSYQLPMQPQLVATSEGLKCITSQTHFLHPFVAAWYIRDVLIAIWVTFFFDNHSEVLVEDERREQTHVTKEGTAFSLYNLHFI